MKLIDFFKYYLFLFGFFFFIFYIFLEKKSPFLFCYVFVFVFFSSFCFILKKKFTNSRQNFFSLLAPSPCSVLLGSKLG